MPVTAREVERIFELPEGSLERARRCLRMQIDPSRISYLEGLRLVSHLVSDRRHRIKVKAGKFNEYTMMFGKDAIGVGADVEFQLISADRELVRMPRYDTDSQIGTDGIGTSTGEIRPNWSYDPEDVVKDIRKLLVKLYDIISDSDAFAVIAGEGEHVPTGGHVHVSGLGATPDDGVLRALDRLIYKPLISICDGARKCSSYDRPSGYRYQPWGWEYRSLPSWIAHPILTKGVLRIVHTICLMFKHIGTLPKNKDDLIEFLSDEVERKEVEDFYEFIEAMHSKGMTLECLDVLREWGITPPKKYPVMTSGEFIPNDIYATKPCSYKFVGAAASRMAGDGVFLPYRVPVGIEKELKKMGLKVERWEMKKTIGLSRSLRERGMAKEVIQAILRLMGYLDDTVCA